VLICSSHTISGVMPGAPEVTRHGFEERVNACAEAGFDGMCLHVRDHAKWRAEGRDDAWMRAVLDRHAMAVPAVEFLADWHDGTDDADQTLAAALAAARCFGADVLNVGADIAGRGVPPRDLARPFVRLCERAADAGVRIALEVLAWGSVSDLDAATVLLDAAHGTAGSGRPGLVVDCWHVFRGGRIGLDDLRRLDPALILGVQLNDAPAGVAGPPPVDTMRRLFCGHGTFDITGFLRAVRGALPAAPVAVEVIAPEVAALPLDVAARRAATSARTALASAGLADAVAGTGGRPGAR
jgi:sugar phosphate isomerase/epimerase